jgi:hypothetical protein
MNRQLVESWRFELNGLSVVILRGIEVSMTYHGEYGKPAAPTTMISAFYTQGLRIVNEVKAGTMAKKEGDVLG